MRLRLRASLRDPPDMLAPEDKREPASEEYCNLAEVEESLKKQECFWKRGLYIRLCIFIYYRPRQFPFNFSIHPSFMCWYPSQIFKLRHIFEVYNSYLYVANLSCILITRHKYDIKLNFSASTTIHNVLLVTNNTSAFLIVNVSPRKISTSSPWTRRWRAPLSFNPFWFVWSIQMAF